MDELTHHATCTMCGCVCDDLSIRTQNGRVIAAERACELAEPWFLGQTNDEHPAAYIDERPVTLEAALAAAAELLGVGRSPLIYGLSRSSTPGQRAAVRLADALGATIDTTASTCHAPSIIALQTVGESTCSLGEVKNRSDLIVYWGVNPLVSHPRHMERFVDAPGQFVPRGRADRKVIVIDTQRTASAEVADEFIQVNPGADFELIWTLRAMLQGFPAPADVAGVPAETVTGLHDQLKASTYGAVFFGLGLTRHGPPHANVEALLRLVTDLNAHTRCIARRMRVPGDVAGADTVLCWQTGFPFSVNLARGYPRYSPGEYSATNLLEREEADCALLVGGEGEPKLSSAARRHLASIPTILLEHPGITPSFTPRIRFTTAAYGVHQPGVAYRMDETPIPLPAFLASNLPSDHEVLAALEQRITRKVQVD